MSDACYVYDPLGRVCTLDQGHQGEHVAHDIHGDVVAAWPNRGDERPDLSYEWRFDARRDPRAVGDWIDNGDGTWSVWTGNAAVRVETGHE